MESVSAAIVAAKGPCVKTAFPGHYAGPDGPTPEYEYLTDYAPREKFWDDHRRHTEEATHIYGFADESEYLFARRLGERMGKCSPFLNFAIVAVEGEEGKPKFKLVYAWFCKVRTCPVCQWRRSLMHRARFLKAFDKLNLGETPSEAGVSFIFMTLTVENPDVTDLRTTLSSMSKGWMRFKKRKEFAGVLGWVRSTEVTWSDKPNPDAAHPHFHVLMMVRNSWFKKSYVSLDSWRKAWKESMRLSYEPWGVHVEKVGRRDENGKKLKGPMRVEDLKKSVIETLKYAVKSEDMLTHPDWFLEFTRQVRSLKFIASGGDFKGWFRDEKDESQQDLLLVDEEEQKQETELARMDFEYMAPVKRYTRMTESREPQKRQKAS